MNGEDKLFCRVWIYNYLQNTPRALRPYWDLSLFCIDTTGRKKQSKVKREETFVTNIPTPGGDLGDELGEHHASPMHGGEGSGQGGRNSTNSC